MHLIRTAAVCCAALASLAGEDATAPTLRAETNRPALNLFIPGEAVQIHLGVGGLASGMPGLILALRVEDALGREIHQRNFQVPTDQGEDWATTIDAPAAALGYYRVRAELSSGATLPQLGNRSAGFITYAVVPDPATRKPTPPERTYFGMQGGFNDAAADIAPLLGVRWMMDGSFKWRSREPERAGQFATRPIDSLVADPALAPRRSFGTYGAERKPWPILPMFCNVLDQPDWTKTLTPKARQCALTPEGETAFRAYCTASAKTNARLRPDLAQRIYEITWEPCIPWGFTGKVADVVRLHALAYESLHAGDPAALVVGPCLSGIGSDGVQELEQHLKEGLGRYLDGYSIHPYHQQPADATGLVKDIRATKALLRRYAGRDLPLFGTEMGYSRWGSPGNELEQARCVIRQDLILLGEGFRFSFAFYVHDLGTDVFQHDPGYGYMHNLTSAAYGPDKLSPKPAAAAYAAMSWLLEGHVSTGAIDWLGGTAWGYAYEDEQGVVLALWDWGGKPRPLSIPVGTGEVEVFDWMGNAVRQRSGDGFLTLVLGPEPTYVRGAATGLWGAKAVKPISLASADLAGFPASAVELRGSVRPPIPGQAFTGSLAIEPDPASGLERSVVPVQIATGKEQALAQRLAVPLAATAGTWAVRIVLLDREGRSVAASGARITIRPPVVVERVRPLLGKDGTRGLAVDIRDAQGGGQHGTISAKLEQLPGSERNTSFTLAPNGLASVSLADRDLAADPTRLYQTAIAVRLDSGFTFTHQTRLGFLPAVRRASAPAIDGNLDDWSGAIPIVLAGAEKAVRSPQFFRGASQQASLRFAWDERALYLAVEAQTPTFLQPETGGLIWRGDSLQLAFNADQGRTFAQTGNGVADAAQQARRSELTLALTSAGPLAWRHTSTIPERLPLGAIAAADLPLAVVWKGGVLRYEIAIPWRQLGLAAAPKAGEALGFAIAVNDLATPGQPDPSALGLFALKEPDGFGMLTLVDPR